MPRVKLAKDDISQFIEKWIDRRGAKYIGFYGYRKMELILVPLTSTEPVIYGYLDGVSADDVRTLWNRELIPIEEWDWAADRVIRPGGE